MTQRPADEGDRCPIEVAAAAITAAVYLLIRQPGKVPAVGTIESLCILTPGGLCRYPVIRAQIIIYPATVPDIRDILPIFWEYLRYAAPAVLAVGHDHGRNTALRIPGGRLDIASSTG